MIGGDHDHARARRSRGADRGTGSERIETAVTTSSLTAALAHRGDRLDNPSGFRDAAATGRRRAGRST